MNHTLRINVYLSSVLRVLLCLVGGVALAAVDARANESGDSSVTTNETGWIVTVGAFGDLEPRFEGARRHGFGYQPIIDYRAVGGREWLNLPNDGFDFALIETQTFRA